MPVIVLASSKGGCGKTSLCVSIASELSRLVEGKDISITIIDGDQQQHSALWAKRDGCPDSIRIIDKTTDESIVEDIAAASEQSQFVIVDLQGAANLMMAMAISQADYVLVPCQGSDQDALEAMRTVKLITNQQKIIGRPINYSIVMTRIHPAVRPRSLSNVISQLESAGANIFNEMFYDRDAIKAMFSFGVPLHKLEKKDVYQIKKAVDNVTDIVKELLGKIRKASKGEA